MQSRKDRKEKILKILLKTVASLRACIFA